MTDHLENLKKEAGDLTDLSEKNEVLSDLAMLEQAEKESQKLMAELGTRSLESIFADLFIYIFILVGLIFLAISVFQAINLFK